jgi:uncharacterized protein
LKAWPVLGISIVESILLLAHWLLYYTWIAFRGHSSAGAMLTLRVALLILSCSFVIASLLSFYFYNPVTVAAYRVAAVWLGLLNYLFFGSILCWMTWGILKLSPIGPHAAEHRPLVAWVFLALAVAVSIYGFINARLLRVRRVQIRLANLPSAWHGRTALLMSDLHLGHVNGVGFARRLTVLAARLRPDIVFIAGDFFDGTKADVDGFAAPFKELTPSFGIFFATGNHDEFGEAKHFLAALKDAGIRVIANEKVIVDGLQILGVPYHDTTFPIRMRANLDDLKIDRAAASILLNHVPNRLPIVEGAGISFQLSGHTHGGQFAPFTWLTQRIFGKFTYGLHSFGKLQVYTSYGAGTWGPPMRVGTTPEVVVLEFR